MSHEPRSRLLGLGFHDGRDHRGSLAGCDLDLFAVDTPGDELEAHRAIDAYLSIALEGRNLEGGYGFIQDHAARRTRNHESVPFRGRLLLATTQQEKADDEHEKTTDDKFL